MGKVILAQFKKLTIILISASIVFSCGSKKGCTDPNSLTYDSKAEIDDESCTYPDYKLAPKEIVRLKNKFIENSSLEYSNQRIWTVVDEIDNILYSIDLTDGGSKVEVELSKVQNVDFEALAESKDHLYIGDIGNNDGNRTDLVIHKIPKIPINNSDNTISSNSEQIFFTYEDQEDFQKNSNTNFDAEAIIYHNNNLYLFTKNHSDYQTKIYEIPAQPGKHVARLKGIFNVNGLITDADINQEGNKIVLTGIDAAKSKSFLWIIKDFQNSQFFNGRKILVDLGSYAEIGQIEGVAFYNSDSIFISNEQDGAILSKLYGLNIGGVK